jgi:ribosomal-protein-alanine N-acetyltransferase
MNFSPFPTLETEHLSLREMTAQDADDLFTLRANPLTHLYTDTTPDASVAETHAYIEKMRLGIAENRWIIWAMEHKADQRVVGTLGIWNIDEGESRADLSYALAPEYQGKGYMREGLSAAIAFGFSQMRLNALEAYTEEQNISSRKLLEKFEFREVDRVDDLASDGSRIYHMIVYRRERTSQDIISRS